MTWVVVLVPVDHRFDPRTSPIKTFGPYASPELAEAARRRVHFDARQAVQPWQDFPDRVPRTYVAEMKAERSSDGPRFTAEPTGPHDDLGNPGYVVRDSRTGETVETYPAGFFAGQDARNYATQLNEGTGR